MRRSRTAATTALLLVPIAAGGFLLQEAPVRQSARLFDQVFSIVTHRYVDSVPAALAYERAAFARAIGSSRSVIRRHGTGVCRASRTRCADSPGRAST